MHLALIEEHGAHPLGLLGCEEGRAQLALMLRWQRAAELTVVRAAGEIRRQQKARGADHADRQVAMLHSKLAAMRSRAEDAEAALRAARTLDAVAEAATEAPAPAPAPVMVVRNEPRERIRRLEPTLDQKGFAAARLRRKLLAVPDTASRHEGRGSPPRATGP